MTSINAYLTVGLWERIEGLLCSKASWQENREYDESTRGFFYGCLLYSCQSVKYWLGQSKAISFAHMMFFFCLFQTLTEASAAFQWWFYSPTDVLQFASLFKCNRPSVYIKSSHPQSFALGPWVPMSLTCTWQWDSAQAILPLTKYSSRWIVASSWTTFVCHLDLKLEIP